MALLGLRFRRPWPPLHCRWTPIPIPFSSDSSDMTAAVSSTKPRLGFSQSQSAGALVLLGNMDRSTSFWRRGEKLRSGIAGGEAGKGKPSIYSSGDEWLCLLPNGCGGDADLDCSTEAWLISADEAGLLAAVVESGGWLLLWWMVLTLSELLVWLLRLLIQPFSSIWFRPDSMFNGLDWNVLMVVFTTFGGGAIRGPELPEDRAALLLAGSFGLAYYFWGGDEVFGPYLGPHEEWVSLLGLSHI